MTATRSATERYPLILCGLESGLVSQLEATLSDQENVSPLNCDDLGALEEIASRAGYAIIALAAEWSGLIEHEQNVLDLICQLSPRVDFIVVAKQQYSLHANARWLLAGCRHVINNCNPAQLAKTVGALIKEQQQRPDRLLQLNDVSDRLGIVGTSPAWVEVLMRARQLSTDRHVTVLISGETGTGKELIAKAIHTFANSTAQPFCAVNCAAIRGDLKRSELFGHKKGSFTGAHADNQGVFVKAQRGTLFLDEVQGLDPETQGLLLRALQEGVISPVGSSEEVRVDDVQTIVATNRSLEKLVADGSFRQDLYYRLNVVRIELPPLRDRLGDIAGLTHAFLRKHCNGRPEPVTTVDPMVLEALRSLPWPGNVRELENVVRSALILKRFGDTLSLGDLPPAVLRQLGLDLTKPIATSVLKGNERVLTLDYQHWTGVDKEGVHQEVIGQVEKWLLCRVLEECDGNQSAAARKLDITRGSLRNKLRQHGITIASEIDE